MAAGELTLLYSPGSFYSQKAQLYLTERNIPFTEKIISLAGGETYKPWFMRINPEGQVPVLLHGEKYIPDSNAIIDYLEETYDSPRKLMPPNGSSERQSVQRLSDLLRGVEIEVVTYGMIMFPQFSQGGQITGVMRRMARWRAASMRKYPAGLEKYKRDHPDLRDIYTKKQQHLINFTKRFSDETTVKGVLEKTGKVLDQIEDELESRKGDWLCGQAMTVADIHLAVLLGRLNFVGLRHRYWEGGVRPNLEAYYLRLKNHGPYLSICEPKFNPITMMFLPMLRAKLPVILGVSVTVAAVAVGVHMWRKGDLEWERFQFWK